MSNLKRLIHKHTLAKLKYNKGLRKTGLPFNEFCEYLYEDTDMGIGVFDATLYGKNIKRLHLSGFVHNVEEIFVDEIYKFASYNESPVILDCGANIGLSIVYFKSLFPNAKITAFEPDRMIYDACIYNVNAFNLKDVSVIKAAVWKEDGVLSFLPDDSLGGRLVDDKSNSKVVQVDSIRLKDYLNQKIDFLKIDIEGAEHEVMFDCRNDLGSVDKIFLEFHGRADEPQGLHDLLLILKDAGFRYYLRSAWNTMPHPFVDFKNSHKLTYDLQLNIFGFRM